jgi:hypothetical protein
MAAARDRHPLTARAATATPIPRIFSVALLATLAATLVVSVSGCGSTQSHPDLPDLATKSPKAAENKNVMSGSEQKRAIDEMLARRDRQERAAREAAGSQ